MSDASAPRTLWPERAWLMAWCALAVVHVTQAIVGSGFRDHPGDSGDGRFNQLVLEHGYRALIGPQAWVTPAMFFPVEGTLGLSDTHAGTLPLYVVARLAGLGSGQAYQAWFLAVAALNAWAMARALRALGVNARLAGPAVFLGCTPMSTVAMAGAHAQALPFFPALFAIDQLVRFARDGRRIRWVTFGGWCAWQFAAAPYLAYFFAVAAGPVVAWSLWRGWRTPGVGRGGRIGAIAVAVVGGMLCALAVHAHVTALGRGYPASASEPFRFAPTALAWLTAPHGSWMHGGRPGGAPADTLPLLVGAIPWLAACAAGALAWRRRREAWAGSALALLGAALLLVVVFTAPTREIGSLHAHAAAQIEVLRAFRASGRVVVVVAPLLVLGTAVAAAHAGTGRRWQGAVVATLAVAGAAETVTLHQPGTSIADSRLRTEAVIAAWRTAGDRPVLAFAPGVSNQSGAVVHLDAWSAALELGRRTLNGYSGSGPESHTGFGFLLTPDAARALCAHLGIEETRVSIVTDWEPERATRLGIQRMDTRPVARLAGWDLQPARWDLFAALETFVIEGRTVYQFTPPAEVVLPLPDGPARVSVLTGMRPGSYDRGGESDGVEITWASRDAAGTETILRRDHLDPRARPEHRGLLPVEFPVPDGTGRDLILRTTHGPAGDGRWDWPVFGELRIAPR